MQGSVQQWFGDFALGNLRLTRGTHIPVSTAEVVARTGSSLMFPRDA